MKLRSVKRAHHFTQAFRHAFTACAGEHVKQTMLFIVQLGSHVLRQVTHTHPQKRTDQPVGLLDPDRGNHTTTTGGRNGQDGQIDSPCCCTGSRCGNPSPCCSCDISGFISPLLRAHWRLAEDVGAEAVARDAGQTFDSQREPGGHGANATAPLAYSGRLDAQLVGQGTDTACGLDCMLDMSHIEQSRQCLCAMSRHCLYRLSARQY